MTIDVTPGAPGGVIKAKRLLTSLRARPSTVRIVLCVVVMIPLLAMALLGAGYASVSAQRDALSKELSRTTSSATGTVLREDTAGTAVMGLVLELAKESSVEVVSLDAGGSIIIELAGNQYRRFKYSMQMHAKLSQLVAFLNRIEQSSKKASNGTAVLVERITAKPQADQSWLVNADVAALAPASQ